MNLRGIVSHNFWLKVFSMLSAAVIWCGIRYGLPSMTPPPRPAAGHIANAVFKLPVAVLASPGDASSRRITPAHIAVMVEGKDVLLHQYAERDFRAYVDMTGITNASPHSRTVLVDAPEGVLVLETTPRTVVVETVFPDKGAH